MHAQGAYAPKGYGVLAIAHPRHAVQNVSPHTIAANAWRDSSMAPFADPAVAKSAWGDLWRVRAPLAVSAWSTPYKP